MWGVRELMDKSGLSDFIPLALGASYAVAIMLIGAGVRGHAQPPPTDRSFEVATIKPIDPSHRFDPKHYWAHVNPAGASYWSMTVAYLVDYAYGVDSTQITGPEWTTSDRFDIEAKFPEGADHEDDRKMLQALLKDRFRLAFHIEKRELETYVLVVAKHGAKLELSLPGPAIAKNSSTLEAGENKVGAGTEGSKVTVNPDGSNTVDLGEGGILTMKLYRETWTQHFEASKITMKQMSERLGSCLGSGVHRVVDETGLNGSNKVAYDCPLPRPQIAASTGILPPDPQDGSSLIRSLDALGLKLEKRKIPTDVYVIDHVEMPSEN
jgi:uncharacterized protein (TIGR03435 family)